MSSDARPIKPAAAVAPSIEDLALRGGIRSEHVVLASEDPAVSERAPSGVVRQRFRLHNRATGIVTVLRIYTDGYLGVAEQQRGGPVRDYVLDLKFVDPSPRLSRYVARKILRLVLAFASLSVLAATLVYFSVWPIATLPIALASIAATAAASAVFARRTQEQIEFRTTHGRAIVLTLTANIGCLRAYRRVTPKLVAAIRAADRERVGEKSALLRQEMREHYRLAAAGLVTEAACAAATRRILNQFP